MSIPLTLEALQTLDAINRKGSFAAAAYELHKVPSAISYIVHKLEQDLNVKLFNRSGHRAELTETGQFVLEQGQRILEAADALTIAARRIASGWESQLRIAVDSLIPVSALFPAVELFYTQQAHIEIKLTEEVLGGSLDALLCDRADLVIGTTHVPNSAEFKSRAIGKIEFLFVASADHPLSGLKGPITTAQIKEHIAIVAADSSQHRPSLTVGLIDGQKRITVPNLQAKLEAHAAGLGVGFAPKFRAAPYLRDGKLVKLSVTHGLPPADIHILWRKENTGKALNWFLEYFQSTQCLQQLLH